MGCDIHIVIERQKTEYNYETGNHEPAGEWLGVYASYLTPRVILDTEELPKVGEQIDGLRTHGYHRSIAFKGRNYDFFARLAGVRGEGPEPKGLPRDRSELTGYHLSEDDSDLHSHSWDTLEDFAWAWIKSQPDETVASAVGNHLQGDGTLLKFVTGTWDPEDLKLYRVCYAFDN
jgi:hypothetical protein